MKEAYASASRVRESFNNYQNGAVSNQLMALVGGGVFGVIALMCDRGSTEVLCARHSLTVAPHKSPTPLKWDVQIDTPIILYADCP
jgi:hypothetical protein